MAERRTPGGQQARATSGDPTLVLVAVAGLTPSVITETLYVLLVRDRYRGPMEVHVLTTEAGRDAALKRLLAPGDGALHHFCRDYRIPSHRILFPPEHIHVLRAADGRSLADIRSSADNAAGADQIMAFAREQTSRPDVVIHGSIAGGRKTMSMLLGSAFMLFGRPQDRLSHVLVSPDLEGVPDFFYPPPRPTPLRLANGRIKDASRAHIELADVPFLRLRHLLPAGAGSDPAHHADLVRATQVILDESAHPTLTLDLAAGQVTVGSRSIRMEPRSLGLYALFTTQKAERCVRTDLPTCGACRECFFSAGKRFPDDQRDRLLALYQQLGGRDPAVLARVLAGSDAAATLRSLKSRANAAVRRSIGLIAGPYLISATGGYEKRHGLLLDKGRIRIIP